MVKYDYFDWSWSYTYCHFDLCVTVLNEYDKFISSHSGPNFIHFFNKILEFLLKYGSDHSNYDNQILPKFNLHLNKIEFYKMKKKFQL